MSNIVRLVSRKLFLEINTEQLAVKPQRKFFYMAFQISHETQLDFVIKKWERKNASKKQYNFDALLFTR